LKYDTTEIAYQLIDIRLLDALQTTKINAKLLHTNPLRVTHYIDFWTNNIKRNIAIEFYQDIKQLQMTKFLPANIPDRDLDYDIMSLLWLAFKDYNTKDFRVKEEDLKENYINGKFDDETAGFFYGKAFLDLIIEKPEINDLLYAWDGYKSDIIEGGSKLPYTDSFEMSWGMRVDPIHFELNTHYSLIHNREAQVINENLFYEFFINSLSFPELEEDDNELDFEIEETEEAHDFVEEINELEEDDEAYFTVDYLLMERFLAESFLGEKIFDFETQEEGLIESVFYTDVLEDEFHALHRELRQEARLMIFCNLDPIGLEKFYLLADEPTHWQMQEAFTEFEYTEGLRWLSLIPQNAAYYWGYRDHKWPAIQFGGPINPIKRWTWSWQNRAN
jgi:hypothetical protein